MIIMISIIVIYYDDNYKRNTPFLCVFSRIIMKW
jgi:hypothetical protein